MKYIRILILSTACLLASSCKTPEPELVMSELDEMIGSEVRVTTSHPVALSSIKERTNQTTVHDTATFLKATLKSVDPSGIVLIVNDQKVWIGRDSIVAVATSK